MARLYFPEEYNSTQPDAMTIYAHADTIEQMTSGKYIRMLKQEGMTFSVFTKLQGFAMKLSFW